MSLRSMLRGSAWMAAVFSVTSLASAHAVTVNGDASDWFARSAAADNVGLVARDAASAGEFVWRDATGDQRTDLGVATDADITEVHVTSTSTGLFFLVRFAAARGASTPQLQIAIDTNRTAASGATALAGFADTSVASAAAWEFLIQTQTDSSVRVLDTTYASVATGSFSHVGTVMELSIPWTALGLSAPPSAPLRFTMATFYEIASGDTADIGGAGTSNALDVVTNYGTPSATGTNTWTEVMDGVVDYSVDTFFGMTGDVYAPLAITRFVAVPGASGPGAWWSLRNVSPVAIAMASYATGNETTPGGTHGMGTFAGAGTLAAGGTVTVAYSATQYNAVYGTQPDFEITSTDAAVPDLAPLAAWSTGASTAINPVGDALVVLDRSFTMVDIVTYGSASYPGVTAHAVPASGQVLTRDASATDTDDNQADFTNGGTLCGTGVSCGTCQVCSTGVCAAAAAGASCSDGNMCNGAETCDSGGACTTGTALSCDDSNPCTGDSCSMATGCVHTIMAGASCSDGNMCNGAEVCSGAGACVAGTPLSCGDTNACTTDSCNPGTGCVHAPVATGTACDDADACNGHETCNAAGSCQSGTALSCSDSNVCTTDTCSSATGCVHAPVAVGTSCGDGNPCNGNELCTSTGTCAAGTAISCDDSNPCTTDSCSIAGGCAHVPVTVGAFCSDGNPCNGLETCSAIGVCTAGTPVACTPTGNACVVNACVVATGSCATHNVTAGTSCDDGNPCNGTETCTASGTCVAGTPPVDAGSCMADAGDASVDAADVTADVVQDVASDIADVSDVMVADAGTDAAADVATDAGTVVDVAVQDTGSDVTARDANSDGGTLPADATGENAPYLSGGSCACRTAGTHGTGNGSLVRLLGLSAAIALASRRRRARRA